MIIPDDIGALSGNAAQDLQMMHDYIRYLVECIEAAEARKKEGK